MDKTLSTTRKATTKLREKGPIRNLTKKGGKCGRNPIQNVRYFSNEWTISFNNNINFVSNFKLTFPLNETAIKTS